MDVITSSSSGNVKANLKHDEDDREYCIVANQQSNSETQPEDSYSVTARWRMRAAHYKELQHGTISQWCQHSSPAIKDLNLPAAHSANAYCTRMCHAIAELNAGCERFAKRKEEYPAKYAVAQKELAEADKNLEDAKRQLANAEKELVEHKHHGVIPTGNSTSQMLELLTMTVAVLTNLVSSRNDLLTGRAELMNADKLMNADNDLVACKAATVALEADGIHGRHSMVKFILGALIAAGNNATQETDNSRGSSSSASIDNSRFTTKYESSPTKYDELCNPPVLELHKVDFLHTLTRDQVDLLVPFYKYLQFVFGKASILDCSDTEYRQKIEGTIDNIIRWNDDKSLEPPSTTMGFYIPSNVGQEINEVQPILYAIMVKMAQVLGLVPTETQEEQGIPSDDKDCPHRFASICGTSFVEEYLLAILPGMIGVPIEVKPIAQGKKSKIVRLLLKAQHQVVGHLAKQALFSLDIGGIGQDCTAVGLALTMGSITAVVLELSDVGTADVEVNVRRTKWAPLFDKVTREKLFGEKARDVEASFEIEEESDGMPEGFRLLAQTLVSVHHGLDRSQMTTSTKGTHGSFSMQPHTAESIELGNYLGSGSLAHVLKLVDKKGGNNVFIKVPKFLHARNSLLHEAKALKDLCENNCIPKLYDNNNPIKTLHIKIRCESSNIPCLPMRGLVGRSVKDQFKNDWWYSEDKLEFIVLEVYAALEYANSKGWAHLDVQPSNIITSVDPFHGGYKVMLVDWGCAHRTSEKRTEFFGCPPFSHDDLLFDEETNETNDWYPCLEHDVASLAYTMASLFEGGSVPSWQGDFLDCSNVQEHDKNDRFEVVSKILKSRFQQGDDASQKVKQALFNAILGKHQQRKLKKRRT